MKRHEITKEELEAITEDYLDDVGMSTQEVSDLVWNLKEARTTIAMLLQFDDPSCLSCKALESQNRELMEAYPSQEEVLDCLMTYGDTDDIELDLETIRLAIGAINVLYENKMYEYKEQALSEGKE